MSFTLPLHSKAPQFTLTSTEHISISLKQFEHAPAIVIFFTCNHCPYVIHSDENTRALAEKYQSHNIPFLAINSNSANTYAADSFEKMVERMQTHHFPWTYLHDPSQEVAKAYGALRTPHFFLFDAEQQLVYTGHAINNPKHPEKATSHPLDLALQQLTQNLPITQLPTNPIGCNIKWEGKDPHWMPADACDLTL